MPGVARRFDIYARDMHAFICVCKLPRGVPHHVNCLPIAYFHSRFEAKAACQWMW